jgi:maleate isomerase
LISTNDLIWSEQMAFSSWRGDAGMIMPTMRPGAPEEVIRLLPEGIGMIVLYLDIRRGEVDEFRESLPQYERMSARLAQSGCQVIHPAGAPPFMLLGYEGERRQIAIWEDTYNAQFFTAGSNHLAAFSALGVRRIVGASYSAIQNDIVASYLQQAGIEVLAMEPLEAPFQQVQHIPPFAVYSHIKRLFMRNPGAQGIYIQGAGWRTLHILEDLERDLGVPVVHAVAAKAWEFQKRLKVRVPREGFGVLLRELPDMT